MLPVVYMTGDSAADWTAFGVPKSVLVQKPFVGAQVLAAVMTLIDSDKSDASDWNNPQRHRPDTLRGSARPCRTHETMRLTFTATTIERAYQLAESGSCRAIGNVT